MKVSRAKRLKCRHHRKWHDTAWTRTSREITQWARQSPEFAPEKRCLLMEDRSRPCTARRSGSVHKRPIVVSATAFHPEITPPPPYDRLHRGKPDSARPGIGGPIAFQSQSVHGKDTSKPREIHIGQRNWFSVGYSGRNSHEPEMISKEFKRGVRPEPHFHDVDGAGQWCSVIQKVLEKFPNIDSKFIAKQWLNSLYWDWRESVLSFLGTKLTTALHHTFEPFQGHCSRPVVTPSSSKKKKTDRNTARMDECNLSFNCQ